MPEKVWVMSEDNMSETLDWLAAALSEKKASQKEILSAQLLVEENFAQMKRLNDSTGIFSASIAVKERFGNVNVELSARGEEYFPFADFDFSRVDEADCASYEILKANKRKLRFYRRKGKSIVVIKAHAAEANRTRRMLLGLAGGAVLGSFLSLVLSDSVYLHLIDDNILDPVQKMLLNILMLVSAPMIFFSILSGIANISDTASLGRIGARLMILSLPKLAFYVALGLFAGDLLGGFASFPDMMAKDEVQDAGTKLRDLIIGIIPGDIITPFHTNNVLQMLFLAVFFGIMLAKAGGWANWAKDGINFFSRFFMELLDVILPFLPLLVFVSMAKLVLHTGLASILAFGKVVAVTALGLPIAICISGLLVLVLGRLSPLPFVSKLTGFISLPFSLSDSTASMPYVMSFCREKLGMEEKFTKFVIPAGMQINMDGTAYYVAILSMMLAHTFGVTIDLEFCVMFFLAQFLIALTGIGIIAMPSIYAAFGIPGVAVAMVIGIEPILDMFGTAQSVAGNITSSFIACRKEKLVNEGVYKQK